MVRRLLALGSAAVCLALLLPSGSGAARLNVRHICEIQSCTTVTASRKVRVIQGALRLHYGETLTDYAVWLPTGLVTELGYVTPRIAGIYIAYPYVVEGSKYEPNSVTIAMARLDVKDGVRTTTPRMRVDPDGPGAQFALTSAGSVAWISETEHCVFCEGGNGVYLLPSNSDLTKELSHGPAIDPHSLALIPGHIYWLEGGIPRAFAAS
jgi:hypothetical protein